MKKTRRLQVTVKPTREALREFVADFNKAAALNVPSSQSVLNFVDQASLFATLTAKRMDLLRRLRHIGPVSIKQLSKSLKRDYKNVHTDVQMFIKLDLIKTNKTNEIFVPWDSISIDLSLAA